MLDSTTMALRAALLVRNGFANTNGYGYSIGSIGSMVTKQDNQISYINGSVGTLRTQPGRLTGGITRKRIEDVISYNANKPIGTLSEKVLIETGEQTASGSATQKALENAAGVGSQNNTSTQDESVVLFEEPKNDFQINNDSPTAPTQQQAQPSFFEKNKKMILIAVVLIVVAALFFWKK